MIRKGDHITTVGRMNHRIALQTRTGVADGMGGQTVTWATTVTLWADIMPLSMSERSQADRLIADASHKIIIRHRAVSPTTQRFLFGARVFNITGTVNPDQSSSHLIVYAREEA